MGLSCCLTCQETCQTSCCWWNLVTWQWCRGGEHDGPWRAAASWSVDQCRDTTSWTFPWDTWLVWRHTPPCAPPSSAPASSCCSPVTCMDSSLAPPGSSTQSPAAPPPPPVCCSGLRIHTLDRTRVIPPHLCSDHTPGDSDCSRTVEVLSVSCSTPHTSGKNSQPSQIQSNKFYEAIKMREAIKIVSITSRNDASIWLCWSCYKMR